MLELALKIEKDDKMNRQKLEKKVRGTVDSLLYEKGYVAPVDLFMQMDKLTKQDYEAWRKKQVPFLERVIQGNLGQLSFIMKQLRKCARERGLKPSFTDYRSGGKGEKIRLRFSKTGQASIEKHYATHYVSPKLKKSK